MALSKSNRSVVASTPNSAGSTTSSTAQTVNYGVSGVVKFTNGGTAPTTPCAAYLDYSPDNGSNWFLGAMVGVGDLVASSVVSAPYAIAIGGGADWTHYRIRFTGNTGQSVTVQADDSTTTGL